MRIVSDLFLYPIIKFLILSNILSVILGITLGIMVSDTPHYENVPEGWCISTIGEVFNLQAGKNISANDIHECSQNFPYACYGGNGIRGYVSDYNRDGKFPIIGRQGALCGNVNFAEGKFYATEHAVVVTCFAGVNIEWARYVLEAMNLNQYATATAQPGLSVATVNEVEFMLPPLNEQCRIAEFIANCFEAIESLTTQTNDLRLTLDKAKSKILDLAIHGKLVTQDANDESASELLKRINTKAVASCDNAHKRNLVPDSWIWCTLQDSFDITMGSSPTSDNLNRENQGIEFHQGKVFFSDRYILPSDIYTSQPGKLAEPQSILLCVRAPVGTVNITDRQICIGRGLCSLKPSKSIDLQYSYYVLQTCSEELEQKATGSTFKAIGGDVVKKQTIPLPPLNEQKRIVTKIEELFAVLDEIQKSIEA